MKIAVISDVHANLIALSLALNDAEKSGVNKYVFLGDYVTDGEDCNQIIQVIKQKADYAIMGNREKYVLNYAPKKGVYNNYKPIAYTYKSLNEESLEYIKALRDHQVIKVGNFRILMIHGDGYGDVTNDFSNMFDTIIENYDFDICLFGHFHKYVDVVYKNKRFINPGSVGQPADTPTYKYYIIEVDETVNVTLKEFKVSDTYDEFKTKYINSNYYQENFVWGNLVLKSVRDGKDYCGQFVALFKQELKNKKDVIYVCFNEMWNETYKEFCDKLRI